MDKGYTDPRWGGYRQIAEAGGHVRKGEKGTPIMYVEYQSRTLAARTERARQTTGRVAAEAERRRAAAELHLPVEHGKVLFPDAQIEYVTAAGLAGRCHVEVASEHYGGGAIRAKAAAGFQMYAAAGRAATVVRRALAGAGAGSGRGRRGGRAGREYEVFEL